MAVFLPQNQKLTDASGRMSHEWYMPLQSLAAAVGLQPITFAQLPTPGEQGQIRTITDGNTTTWGATVAGGGANKVLVWYNGANWTVIGK